MNNLLIAAVAVVGFCYFGGNKCPKVLKDNKEMLLGVLVGLALCSFMGVRLEGISVDKVISADTLKIPSDVVINTDGDSRLEECLSRAHQNAHSANQQQLYNVDDTLLQKLQDMGGNAYEAYLSAHAETQAARSNSEEALATKMVEYASGCFHPQS